MLALPLYETLTQYGVSNSSWFNKLDECTTSPLVYPKNYLPPLQAIRTSYATSNDIVINLLNLDGSTAYTFNNAFLASALEVKTRQDGLEYMIFKGKTFSPQVTPGKYIISFEYAGGLSYFMSDIIEFVNYDLIEMKLCFYEFNIGSSCDIGEDYYRETGFKHRFWINKEVVNVATKIYEVVDNVFKADNGVETSLATSAKRKISMSLKVPTQVADFINSIPQFDIISIQEPQHFKLNSANTYIDGKVYTPARVETNVSIIDTDQTICPLFNAVFEFEDYLVTKQGCCDNNVLLNCDFANIAPATSLVEFDDDNYNDRLNWATGLPLVDKERIIIFTDQETYTGGKLYYYDKASDSYILSTENVEGNIIKFTLGANTYFLRFESGQWLPYPHWNLSGSGVTYVLEGNFPTNWLITVVEDKTPCGGGVTTHLNGVASGSVSLFPFTICAPFDKTKFTVTLHNHSCSFDLLYY